MSKSAVAKLIPPDGGWGWMIVCAYALNNLIMVPLIQGMGLVFKDIFAAINISATETTIIISVCNSFGMAMGLSHGPLLRIFGYRKIALLGSTLFVTGIFMTAFSTKFIHFLISYGLLTSFGIGLTMASFSLAINTYFEKKRGRVMGIAMTFTGLGPILIPQLISVFTSIYTSQGTILILGALALHTIVASLLLQPIKWHAKYTVDEPIDNERADTVVINHQFEKISASVSSLNNGDFNDKNNPTMETIAEATSQVIVIRRNSGSTVNLGSCPLIFDDTMIYGSLAVDEPNDNNEVHEVKKRKGILKHSRPIENSSDVNKQTPENDAELNKETSKKSRNFFIKFIHAIISFFDLKLLSDPIFVNIILGTSIATFSEITFSVMTPYILNEFQFTTLQMATVMSTIGIIDLFTRGLSPFVGEWLNQTPRVMYLASLVMLIASRTTLIFCTGFIPAMFMAIGLGIAKAFRAVYITLVLPTYVPIHRLADATGLQTVCTGIILMGLGPVIGIVRERLGNYVPCIILMNFLTAITIIMWVTEMLIVWRLSRKKTQYAEVALHD